LLEQGIIGGYDLGQLDERYANYLLLCCTELNDRPGIDRLVAAVPRSERSIAAS
jgi:glycine dehydrogenase subunit 1